ncbi:hypothetical protein [Barnesiella sp. B2-R-119]|nr:hypothetical protein [Barnesiella sp. B2-R-119]MCM0688175.1 hypothetical protein [Barnesiella sp. B2-R-119]
MALRQLVRLRDTAGGLKVAFQFRYKDSICTSPLCGGSHTIRETPKER